MIISASRRTDIPAFYSRWFLNRIRAGYCTVPNPLNHKQVSRVSLKPEDVDVIVFWTRNAGPLIHGLHELDKIGLKYYFQYTLLNNPREIDKRGIPYRSAIQTFKKLSETIGSERVIWRYDPIVFSNKTDISFHIDAFKRIAADLQGYTKRVVISIVDRYKKSSKRMSELKNLDVNLIALNDIPVADLDFLMETLSKDATRNGLEIFSCAENISLEKYGIRPGKCIDDEFIKEVFGIRVSHTKDPNQREACGCVSSKDIGMYDTCLFECQYCYATSDFENARINVKHHDPSSPSLIGYFEANPTETKQLKLF